MDISAKIQSKLLSRERNPGEYELYRAGLEWDLVDPIVIEDRDDIKSGDRWSDRVEPYWHQVTNLITFCRRLPVTLLADDVGLGKTISAGLIVSELAARDRLNSFLVVCPKILGPQWKEELETKFGISSKVVIGAALAKVEPEVGGAIITTYDSARLHLEKLPPDRFEMMILDEAHKLRNLFGVQKPPQVALKMKQALEERRFRYVLMLTATPIQNRLWDLYSLVDLLSVARGHQNPFGSPGMFERKYVLDPATARQLRPDRREEFQSIVYGYMSRVRRGDAKLYFPSRVVHLHPMPPSRGELQLIEVIKEPIKKLNRLTQIGILKALVSSPEALARQLENMDRNKTVPPGLADAVADIVRGMPTAAKLQGLGTLVSTLRDANPNSLRVVVFTTRRETQTTIEAYLSGLGFKVGVINGQTGGRNQETIAQFRANPPRLSIIVSTEAGSEGVNLQAANVLVNYDLPWNPMIVEQRIGRVQRLGSEHEHVVIYNTVLRGTFEEYIVGRLMEKLQMASHAIGDLESLLQASGMDSDDDDIEDKILDFVLKSLAGKDAKRDLDLRIASIDSAKVELENERKNIDDLFGGSSQDGLQGPRAPDLPPIERSMTASQFVVSAYRMLGGEVDSITDDSCVVRMNGAAETLYFSKEAKGNALGRLVAAGTPDFNRLVDAVVRSGIHRVRDIDNDPKQQTENLAKAWVSQFEGITKSIKITGVDRMFEGSALVRVKANVKHDSFERLLDVACPAYQIKSETGTRWMSDLPVSFDDIAQTGVGLDEIGEVAKQDPVLGEFCRFYLERRDAEVVAAGGDTKKAARLSEEFTPNIEMEVAGLDGNVCRAVRVTVTYSLGQSEQYNSDLFLDPHANGLYESPEFGTCSVSGRSLPVDCLAKCEVSVAVVQRHLLLKSTLSGRAALAEHVITCAVTGRAVLLDETLISSVTGERIAKDAVAVSEISGLVAEPKFAGQCAFTGTLALNSELSVSELNGKFYRTDQQAKSAHSGKTGHRSEFVECPVTRTTIAEVEAEVCEETQQKVRPGVLVACEETGRRVIPDQLGRCEETGRRVLRTQLIESSISGARLLQSVGLRSRSGDRCLTSEGIDCAWSGQLSHPDDIVKCSITGLNIRSDYREVGSSRLKPLSELLDGMRHGASHSEMWSEIAKGLSASMKGAKCTIEAATPSPDGGKLAVRGETRAFLGLRTNRVGAVFSLGEREILGHLAIGRATAKGWEATG